MDRDTVFIVPPDKTIKHCNFWPKILRGRRSTSTLKITIFMKILSFYTTYVTLMPTIKCERKPCNKCAAN